MGGKARRLRQEKPRTSLEDELVLAESQSWPLLGLNGEPLSLEEWMRLHLDEASFRVAYTALEVAALHFEVSTVWLGVDHSGGAKPLIYETVVLDSDGRSVHVKRYPDRETALAGHQEAVDAVEAGRLVGRT
jgi:hypothetical protein